MDVHFRDAEPLAEFVYIGPPRGTRSTDLLGSELVAERHILGALVFQIEYWWVAGYRPRLTGLTDEEYLWEPVGDCWTLHPTDDGLALNDHAWPPPRPSPFATIAWRLCHIGRLPGTQGSHLFREASPEPLTTRM